MKLNTSKNKAPKSIMVFKKISFERLAMMFKLFRYDFVRFFVDRVIRSDYVPYEYSTRT